MKDLLKLVNAPRCWGLNEGMTGWERQHGVQKTDRILEKAGVAGLGVEGSQRQGWVEQTAATSGHAQVLGPWGYFSLEGRGEAGIENQMGATSIKWWGAGAGAAAVVV